MQMTISDELVASLPLSTRDIRGWLRMQHSENLKAILATLGHTGYMAMGQAVSMYGGAKSNARREIKDKLVTPGFVGREELNGNGYIYLRPAGARLTTGSMDAEGVPGVPVATERMLTIAFARVEWWLSAEPTKWWKVVPSKGEPLGLADLEQEDWPFGTLWPQHFRAALRNNRNGVYCLGVGAQSRWVRAYYLVVDLNRSRSAYVDLVNRLQYQAKQLAPRSSVWVRVMADSDRRADDLARIFTRLPCAEPVEFEGADQMTHYIDVMNGNLADYKLYGFHRQGQRESAICQPLGACE